MTEMTTIWVDLAKSVFQLHGVGGDGKTILRQRLRRSEMPAFFQNLSGCLSGCLVGMEACSSAHYWACELTKLGHDVRLMQPNYVKGYVKRGNEEDQKSWMDPRFPYE